MGLTTWVGYLYIGLRAKRTRWLVAAGVYGVALIGAFVILGTGPVDDNGDTLQNTWQANVSTALVALIWFGGIVHGLISNVGWLRWRAGRQRPG